MCTNVSPGFFCCPWWMVLIERHRRFVPRVLSPFLTQLKLSSTPSVSNTWHPPRQVAPPSRFLYQPKAVTEGAGLIGESLNPQERWEGTRWFIKSTGCRRQHTSKNLRGGLTCPSAHACMTSHAAPHAGTTLLVLVGKQKDGALATDHEVNEDVYVQFDERDLHIYLYQSIVWDG